MKAKIMTTRRLFFWKAGAALSAPLAVVASQASPAGADDESVRERLARLEDENAIRELNRAYVGHVNSNAHEEAARLFVDLADAPTDRSLRSISAVPVEEDLIELSADRTTATARIYCTVQIATPIEPTCPLVEMAREQGGGVLKRSERGVFENVYEKRDGTWKIKHLAYRPA